MRKIIGGLLVLSLVLIITPAIAKPANNGLNAPNGVDIFRGAWVGKISLTDTAQINLYFGEAVPINDTVFKTSGYFYLDQSGGQKGANVSKLPMMAIITNRGGGTYDLSILANVMMFGNNGNKYPKIMKLIGTAEMGNPSVTDDSIKGNWNLPKKTGTWSVHHRDRQNVEPLEVIPDPSLNYFDGDLKVHLFGAPRTPIEERNPIYGFDVQTNIVMDRVEVTSPDGISFILPPYTDLFSPNVDMITQFRFANNIPGLPIQGKPYTFTALDVAGNPIPKVDTTDVWLNVTPLLDPPFNVIANKEDTGINVSWDPVTIIPNSFDPVNGSGWYQIEVYKIPTGEMVYGANQISGTSYIIPQDVLTAMNDGDYQIEVNAHSVAPVGSAGHGIEFSSRDPTQYKTFTISGGQIVIH